MKNKPKNKITMEDLMVEIRKIDARTDFKIDSLAAMIQKGFQEQGVKLDELFEFRDKTEQSLFEVKSDIKTIYGKLDSIDGTLAKINPMLDGLKYSDRDLEKRVTRIENKLGMA